MNWASEGLSIMRENYRDTYLEQQQTEKIETEVRYVDRIQNHESVRLLSRGPSGGSKEGAMLTSPCLRCPATVTPDVSSSPCSCGPNGSTSPATSRPNFHVVLTQVIPV